ncbi:hypothetical protein B0T17DRAFT_538671 [Bombardia bombarda]|uniref:Uncharacterized protein n=1 Tax=Bombardia bombarda TaxID=252184 RepID=A0AA40BVX5_9PEZI|nr:hypothetical protein B0T17DRAFT_538671 [Bombardia bombarda]
MAKVLDTSPGDDHRPSWTESQKPVRHPKNGFISRQPLQNGYLAYKPIVVCTPSHNFPGDQDWPHPHDHPDHYGGATMCPHTTRAVPRPHKTFTKRGNPHSGFSGWRRLDMPHRFIQLIPAAAAAKEDGNSAEAREDLVWNAATPVVPAHKARKTREEVVFGIGQDEVTELGDAAEGGDQIVKPRAANVKTPNSRPAGRRVVSHMDNPVEDGRLLANEGEPLPSDRRLVGEGVATINVDDKEVADLVRLGLLREEDDGQFQDDWEPEITLESIVHDEPAFVVKPWKGRKGRKSKGLGHVWEAAPPGSGPQLTEADHWAELLEGEEWESVVCDCEDHDGDEAASVAESWFVMHK